MREDRGAGFDKVFAALLIAGIVGAMGACATVQSDKGYTICNDMSVSNTACPDDTANVVVGM